MNLRLATFGTLLAITPLALANEFSGEDFSLRFPAAMSSYSPYADVAAKGGSSAASKFGSSVNPAAVAWVFPAAYDYGLSVQYSNLAFAERTHLHFLSEAALFDAHDFGVIRFSFGQVTSDDHTLRDSPLTFTYDLRGARADWAKRWGPVSLGASFSYAETDTKFRTSDIIFADVEKHTSITRVGALWQPAQRWLVGVVGDYGYGPSKSDFLTPTRFGLVSSNARDITRQAVVRPGIAFEWRENALIHLDYQYGRFWNDSGTLEVNRFMAGADLPLARFLFVRTGAVVDVRGDFGWTAGFGVYPRKGVTFDFAYQNDVFPELQREFGHSRTLNASVSVQF